MYNKFFRRIGMSLVVGINKPKQISKWCDYTDADGTVLASFKIRGIAYKAYQKALEMANNQVSAKGFNVDTASKEDSLFHELLFDAVAVHLIEDWKGIDFEEVVNGEIVKREVPFTTENAKNALRNGDNGAVIWLFVKTEAEKMQAEADREKLDILGKSVNFTIGQNTVAKEKPVRQRKSKTQ